MLLVRRRLTWCWPLTACQAAQPEHLKLCAAFVSSQARAAPGCIRVRLLGLGRGLTQAVLQVVKDYLLNFSPQLRPPAAAPTQMLVES